MKVTTEKLKSGGQDFQKQNYSINLTILFTKHCKEGLLNIILLLTSYSRKICMLRKRQFDNSTSIDFLKIISKYAIECKKLFCIRLKSKKVYVYLKAKYLLD